MTKHSWMSLMFATACTSSSGVDAGKATVNGTIGLDQPVVLDAIAFNKDGDLTLKLTDYTGACELEEMNNAHKQGSHYIELYLGAYPGHTGTFEVDDGQSMVDATAAYFTRDATCDGGGLGANHGSITITAITAERVRGTFDLMWSTGADTADEVTGTFDASVCGGGMVVGSGGACVP